MTAILKVTHKAIGVEVRRGTYDVVVDGQRAGSLAMNDALEIPIGPGRHTLQVRSGRNSSRTQTFEAAEDQTVAFDVPGRVFSQSSSRRLSSPDSRSSSAVQSMIDLDNEIIEIAAINAWMFLGILTE